MSTIAALPSVDVSERRTLTAGVEDSITISVSSRDAEYLQTLAGENKLDVDIFEDDTQGEEPMAVVRSTDYAGVVGLPDSGTIYLQPKITETALLRLLQLAEEDDQIETLEQTAEIKAGTQFVDLLAELYTNELAAVMRHGVSRSYERVERQEDYLRGQLNIQQQLQQSGPATTEFHCSHDELTRDTLLNRTALHAARILVRLVEDPVLQRQLHRQVQQLRREISLEPITPEQVSSLNLNRLNDHYADLLRLAELVITNTLIEDLHRGDALGYTLLLDMPDRYQAALATPLKDLGRGLSLQTEPSLEKFLTGDFDLVPKPDYVLCQDGDPVLVLDAKWKDFSRKPREADIYQLISYQQYLNVPGVLLYPDTGDRTSPDTVMEVDVKNGHRIVVGRVPVTKSMDSLAGYRTRMKSSLTGIMNSALA